MTAPELGYVAYETTDGQNHLGNAQVSREYSDTVAREIDNSVLEIITADAMRALAILELNKELLINTSKSLLERETLDYDDLHELAGNIKQLPQEQLSSPSETLKISNTALQNKRNQADK